MKVRAMVAVIAIGSAAIIPIPAFAQDDVPSSECPKMQFVVVNSSTASIHQATDDQGFLGEVVSPVVDAANTGKKVSDKSAGFSAIPTSSVPTTATSVKKPETTQSQSWKQDVWGNKSSTASSSPSSTAQKTTTSASTSTSSSAHSVADTDSAVIGRTYVNIDGVRSGAFIPGVHAEKDQSWREKLEANKTKVNSVATEIINRCPNTKIALIGEDDGAAVVSELARDIGAGKGDIPADRVSGVATFADPTRSEDQPTIASGADRIAATPGTSGKYTDQLDALDAKTAEGAGLATVAEKKTPAGYGDLEDRTVSWCVDGDVRCAVPKAAPLTRLVETSNKNINFEKDPQGSVRYVADILGPAVALAGVEGLAEDMSFGEDGFTFSRASSPEKTLIGRTAMNAESPQDQTETERRFVASGQQLGGMALAAGITVARKVLTPENIAQIAAASAAGPEAGAVVVGLKLVEASTDLFTPQTATTGAVRLLDEVTASGVEVPEVAEAAVTTVVGQTVGQTAYGQQSVTKSGKTPKAATTQWLSAMAADELGDSASDELVYAASKNDSDSHEGASFDKAAVNSAVAGLRASKSQ